MAINEGDNIIFHALKVDDFLTLGIFHSHAFDTGVQCTITCWMFILDELWTVNCELFRIQLFRQRLFRTRVLRMRQCRLVSCCNSLAFLD